MIRLITYTTTALLATVAISFAAPEKATMMAKEKAAWQAFKDKNVADFKKVVSADFHGVYDDGMSTMQKEMDDMQKWDMKSFTMGDYEIYPMGADTVITTYTVVIDGTYGGKDASGTYNCGSVWKKEKGGWQAIFHTNVRQQKPETAATQ
jgi:hypothetical protein